MIESIGVNNSDMNEYQEIVLTRPELSGIIVKSIDGLGPAGANINFTELATIDGAIDNSARIETREIKLDLIFMTNQQLPLIEDVRLKTYKLFPVKKNVTFYIKTDRRGLIHCYGRVEKNEPKIFQKQEGCTITIKCGDPFWHTETLTSKMFYGADPLFEFIYDPSPVDELNTEFGNINVLKEGNVWYEGDADTGIIIEVSARGSATGIQFFDKETGEMLALDDSVLRKITGSSVIAGDTIIVNSIVGKKSVTLIRDGVRYDILNALLPTEMSDGTKRLQWLKLNKGDNVFGYYAEDGLENLSFNVKYDILYEGA